MRNKSLKVPALILAIGLVLSVLAYLCTSIVKEPVITEQDFPYAATYELAGETKTLEGVYRCRFAYLEAGARPLQITRQYEGFFLTEDGQANWDANIIAEQDDFQLKIVFIFTNDYLMGDSDDAEYAAAMAVPYIAAYDQYGVEYTDPEILDKFQVELLSWVIPVPVENEFVFSGFYRMNDGSMLAMCLVGILVMIACLIFVKRDKTIPYNVLDIISIILNIILTFLGLPFALLVIWLSQIFASEESLAYQMDLCVPAITAFALAASISLRRKGFKKFGFFVQFIGPVLFVLLGIFV